MAFLLREGICLPATVENIRTRLFTLDTHSFKSPRRVTLAFTPPGAERLHRRTILLSGADAQRVERQWDDDLKTLTLLVDGRRPGKLLAVDFWLAAGQALTPARGPGNSAKRDASRLSEKVSAPQGPEPSPELAFFLRQPPPRGVTPQVRTWAFKALGYSLVGRIAYLLLPIFVPLLLTALFHGNSWPVLAMGAIVFWGGLHAALRFWFPQKTVAWAKKMLRHGWRGRGRIIGIPVDLSALRRHIVWPAIDHVVLGVVRDWDPSARPAEAVFDCSGLPKTSLRLLIGWHRQGREVGVLYLPGDPGRVLITDLLEPAGGRPPESAGIDGQAAGG